jgi:hypothetical protein
MAKIDIILAVNSDLVALLKSQKWFNEKHAVSYHEKLLVTDKNWFEINKQGDPDYVRVEEIPMGEVGWDAEELSIIADLGSSLHAYNVRFWRPGIVQEILKWLPQKAHAFIDNDLGDLIDVSRMDNEVYRDKLPMFWNLNS